jgi:hypothetical protein
MFEVCHALFGRFNSPLPEHIDPFFHLLVGLQSRLKHVLPSGDESIFWDSGLAELRSDAFLGWIDVFGAMDTAVECVQTIRKPLSQEVLGMAI